MNNFSFKLSWGRMLLCSSLMAGSAVGFAGMYIPSVSDGGLLEGNVVTYGGSNANFFKGTYINQFIGATTLYAAGYTGTRSTVANIEGGYIANDSSMLTTQKANVTFAGTGALGYSSTSIKDHASQVGSVMAGFSPDFPTEQALTGIAYGSKMWTGNLASSFGSGTSFSAPTNAIWNSYNQAIGIGVGANGVADVVNSSWGFTSTNATTQGQYSAGYALETAAIDSLIASTHKLVVFSSGNAGSSAAPFNHASGLGAGWNSLTVGSLGSNNWANPSVSFRSRSGFSSYGPNNYYDPNTNTFVQNVRAAVDIAAPGEEIVGEGLNNFAAGSGTSFSAPIVAGVASLIVDVAKDKKYTNATDSRVLASVLMNSADKTLGWSNNTSVSNGVLGTTQGLDWGVGAGRVNAANAYTQLTSGTTDVAGLGGGSVKATGWDLGSVSEAGPNDYLLGSLQAGSVFSSILRWDAGFSTVSTATTLSGAQYLYLSDLRLELWTANGNNAKTLIGFSDSKYNNTEHIYFSLANTDSYLLRVRFMGENYDLPQTHANAETYGLAWSGVAAAPVPEPASMVALGLGFAAMLRRRRKA